MVQSSLTEIEYRANDEKATLNSRMQHDRHVAVLVLRVHLGARTGGRTTQVPTLAVLEAGSTRPRAAGASSQGDLVVGLRLAALSLPLTCVWAGERARLPLRPVKPRAHIWALI